jgi:hypothetical protein
MSFGTICLRRTSLFVGAFFQRLEILQYYFRLKLGPAATLDPKPIFEMASNQYGEHSQLAVITDNIILSCQVKYILQGQIVKRCSSFDTVLTYT